jgi:hypothetical protein
MDGQIFINYRRDDIPHLARLINDRLRQVFSRNQIFFDMDTLRAGEDFFEAIEKMGSSCNVLIAVIGKNWLKGRRIHDPDDFVRLEISAALKRKITVIPVLADGAKMPTATQLAGLTTLLFSGHSVCMTA